MATTLKVRAKPGQIGYRLRIELEGITPVIWRRVWVEGTMRLVQLHHIIQAAMGWTDAHLHEFKIREARYATPHEEDDPDFPVIDERRILLHRILIHGLKFEYHYDFGDSWTHRIKVELVKPLENPYGVALVEDGARACPPEDCGGSHGYQTFLDELKSNPENEEVKSFLEWVGIDFDPDRFDRYAANAALLRMAWNQWGEKR
jgi:hypothetical protein